MSDPWLDSLGDDPWAVAGRWLAEAREAGLHEPEGAALATAAPDGRPSVRMVLVRGLEENDVRFYTNRESRKAGELHANPYAAICFYWGPPLRRQLRVEGTVEALADDESLAYFATRAPESRLGAWASPQSRPLADREELERRYAVAAKRFAAGDVPLPPWWGGYRLVPAVFELWQNRPNRLHDRARYDRVADGWSRARLGP